LKKLEGTPIRYFNTSAMAGIVSVSPAFAVQGDRAVIALDVPTLKSALRTLQNGPWLADSDAFKTALSNTAGRTGSAFSYMDWPVIYKGVYNAGKGALAVVPAGLLNRAGVDVNVLPSADSVASHLCPSLSVARATPNGVVLTSRSPLPSMEVIAPPLAAVTAVFASFKPFVLPEKEKK
jgi:hypothetical protein